MPNDIKEEISQWVHWFSGILGTVVTTYLFVPSFQTAVNNAVAGHPKLVAFLGTVTTIAVAYAKSRKTTVMLAKVLIFAMLLSFSIRSAASPSQCGTERWDVKTLRDPAAAQVLSRPPSNFSVTQLRSLTPPSQWSESLPRQSDESHLVIVRAWLLGYKVESDQDYHIVIAEPGDKDTTMIAEVPSANCVARNGDKYTECRQLMNHIHKAASKGKMIWFAEPVLAHLVGVVFFDKPHGQTGLAPNAVEIHPVTAISLVVEAGTAGVIVH